MATTGRDGIGEEPDLEEHKALIAQCISLASKAPALPTNFRVGAMLVDRRNKQLLAEGFTNELPGNTHAEQVCLMKLHDQPSRAVASKDGSDDLELLLDEGYVDLYTSVEPCVKRLSGERPCVERILETQAKGKGIQTVYVGVSEPDTFVTSNSGRAVLQAAGIKFVHITGLEDQILKVAKAGHSTLVD